METEIKEDKDMPKWLAPLLSALGSMGSSYMLWIKPMQERMDMLANQVSDLREEVKELRQQNKQYKEELEKVSSQLENNNRNGTNYLPTQRSNSQVQGSYLTKRL